MKILFIYPGFVVREVPLNIMYVSAAAKKAGHQCQLFHFTPYKSKSILRSTRELIIEAFEMKMRYYDPDMVAFTVMVQDYMLTCELTKLAKHKYKKTTVWGGIQPILETDLCFEADGLDYICTGEGEEVFPLLLECLERDKDPSDIAGIWHKRNGNVIKNDRPYLVQNLDIIDFPDRDLMEDKYYNAELIGANILTARGCPFPCSFCQNQELMNIYRGKGHFVRYRSIENVIREMELVIKRYDSPSFYISDEIFTLNKDRVLDFCKEYKRRIDRPFMIQTRIDRMCDEDMMKALKDGGCFMINLAIESGNDHLRNKILKKNTTREHIYKAFRLAKDHGIMTTSFNMIGVPGENIKTIYETIDINREVLPDRILCSIFMPLPGTALGQYCKEHNLLKSRLEETTNYYSQVTVKNDSLSDRTMIGYQGFFDWYVLLSPRWYFFVHLLRLIYQGLVFPMLPKSQFFYRIRENIVEFVYQSKRFLPQKTMHVVNR